MRHVAWCSADLGCELLEQIWDVEGVKSIGSGLGNDQRDDVALHRPGEFDQQSGNLEIEELVAVDLQELDL